MYKKRDSYGKDHIKGYWKDTFIYDDHVEETNFRKNLIVNTGKIMLAGLVHGDSIVDPISYIGQGEGNSSWDNSTPDPDPTQTVLVSEIDRRQPDEIVYIDDSENVSVFPTSRLRITTEYPKNDPLNGSTIREQGLFGGQDVTSTKNTGSLFNVFNHQKIEKTNNFKLVRVVILEFVQE